MSLYPAVIKSYDAPRRKVRIEITGMTDGDVLLPEADLMYCLGDKFNHSEIEIKSGDCVWVDFLGDDPRYPIVLGYRNPEQGNQNGWRKWHHANIELAADGTMILKGKALIIDFSTIETTGVTTNNSMITNKSTTNLDGGVTTSGGGAVESNGGFNVFGGDVVAEGISLKTHVHTEQGDGADVSEPK